MRWQQQHLSPHVVRGRKLPAPAADMHNTTLPSMQPKALDDHSSAHSDPFQMYYGEPDFDWGEDYAGEPPYFIQHSGSEGSAFSLGTGYQSLSFNPDLDLETVPDVFQCEFEDSIFKERLGEASLEVQQSSSNVCIPNRLSHNKYDYSGSFELGSKLPSGRVSGSPPRGDIHDHGNFPAEAVKSEPDVETWKLQRVEAQERLDEVAVHQLLWPPPNQPYVQNHEQEQRRLDRRIEVNWPSGILNHDSPANKLSSTDDSRQSNSVERSKSLASVDETNMPAICVPASLDSYSSDTDESQEALATTGPRMLPILSKHQLMVKLMQEVYVMFDKQWTIEVNSRAGSEASGSSSPELQHSSKDAFQDRKRPAQNRGREEEEEDPKDEKPRKRRSGQERPDALKNGKHALACPYYQKDPVRFSCNALTGSKYRACMGPGFNNVSRLKQHLKRVHKAPIQCTRCWTTMGSLQAMTDHANNATRCESRDSDPQGISQDKMDLINGKWGASWESIFKILFPGAPMLSAYYQRAIPSPQIGTPSSPSSQSLSDFESYSRAELPRLVEANLQAMVDAEIGPLEEKIKSLLVDVVRRCQSTVAQNYGRILSSTGVTGINIAQDSVPSTSQRGCESSSSTLGTAFVQSSFEEPPFRDLPANFPSSTVTTDWATTNPSLERSCFRNLQSDSGYGTLLDDFDCQCGDSQAADDSIDGTCSACGLKKSIIWSLSAPL